MLNWFLQRAKAVAAIAAPLVTTALIKAVEQGTGFDIPTEWEVGIVSVVTGFFVHQTPNQP